MELKPVVLADLVAELDEQVAANPLPGAVLEQEQDGGNFLLFKAMTSVFAVQVESVATVLHAPTVCELPGSPGWLTGVFYWNGSVVPLLAGSAVPQLLAEGDLVTDRAQEPSTANTGRCLVLTAGAVRLGLEVDEVFGVHRLELEGGQARVVAEETGDTSRSEADRKLSDTLHWRLASTSEAASSDAARSGIEPDQSVRVLSLAGILASDEVTRFANRAALERGMADAWTLDAVDATEAPNREVPND